MSRELVCRPKRPPLQWFAALVVLASCTPSPRAVPQPVPASAPLPDDSMTIASFNIQTFGKTKRAKPEVMAQLVAIVRKYDVVAVQELKDASGETPGIFLEAINAEEGSPYGMLLSPRTGTSASSAAKEQYAFYYDSDRLEPLDAGALYPDPEDAFVREPWLARFRVLDGSFSFALLDIHTKPDAAVAEIGALHDALGWARERYPEEDDFIALGDFNASCSYARPSDLDPLPIRGHDYRWIVPDDADTNLSARACAYDRIVATRGADGDYTGSWGVDRSFDDRAVSDHWPVWARFFTKRDAP